jgi:hypothetical protein
VPSTLRLQTSSWDGNGPLALVRDGIVLPTLKLGRAGVKAA